MIKSYRIYGAFLSLLLLSFFSCDKIAFNTKNTTIVLDTVVNFTTVDLSPSFKVCDSIIEKQKKADCFGKTLHKKIGTELSKYKLSTKDSINEIVIVDLIINSNGKIDLDTIISSDNIKKQLPKLDSLLIVSTKKLPIVFPAIKMGIPVTTKYNLPIRILLKE